MTGDEPELDGPKGFRSRFLVVQNAPAQSIPNLGITDVRYDAAVFDTLGEFDFVNRWFRPRRAGYYLVGAHITFTAAVGGIARWLRLDRNVWPADVREITEWKAPTAFIAMPLDVCKLLYLLPTDVIRARCQQDSGGALNLSLAFNGYVTMWGHRIS